VLFTRPANDLILILYISRTTTEGACSCF